MNQHFIVASLIFFLSAQVWKWIFRTLFGSIVPYAPAAAFLGA